MGNKLFGKCLLKKPGNNRQVFALIIGRENDGVLVLARLCWLTGCHCFECFPREKKKKVLKVWKL